MSRMVKSWFLLNQDSNKVHMLQLADRLLSFCYYKRSLPTPISSFVSLQFIFGRNQVLCSGTCSTIWMLLIAFLP